MISSELLEFIACHEDDDTSKLLLSRGKWPGIDMDLAVNTIEGRRRIAAKVPEWAVRHDLLYPTRLCTEQCSSAETALYKLSVLFRTMVPSATANGSATAQSPTATNGSATAQSPVADYCSVTTNSSVSAHSPAAAQSPVTDHCSVSAHGLAAALSPFRIADLTGGLGVDAWHFSKIAGEVLYNEADPVLAECVRHNFAALGSGNICFSTEKVGAENIGGILDNFRPDVVFMDPSRRAESGRKVFLIEDCRPDVLSLKEEIFRRCRHILLKLSPMADITMAVGRLGNVSEVHCVASGGECKELLVLMDREWQEDRYRLFVCESGRTLEFSKAEEKKARLRLPSKSLALAPATATAPDAGTATASDAGQSVASVPYAGQTAASDAGADAATIPDAGPASCRLAKGAVLFEPGKALAKAGVSNSLCERYGLVKLGRFTSLYLEEGPNELCDIVLSKSPDPADGDKRKAVDPEEGNNRLDPDPADGNPVRTSESGTANGLEGFGKHYLVEEIHPLNKRTMKELGKRIGRADVSARNIPITSEELSKRMGLSPKQNLSPKQKKNTPITSPVPHIFGIRVDWTDAPSENLLLLTKPLSYSTLAT